ncbi:MAG TPA: kelch repeat-containing protein [Gemmatimonadota bacterium]|jgi:hypothetical protein
MTSANLIRIGVLGALLVVCQPAAPTAGPGGARAQVATLHVARAAHTATLLPSGQVLIVGGMEGGGGSLASVELFDPSDNSVQEFGNLSEPRVGHTATLLADGRVLITGGYNGEYLSSVEVFDPTTRRFQPAGPLLEGRSGHTATLLPDGRVLFVGGVGRGWTFLRSAELYDPETGRSEAVDPMSVPRESHTATLLADGRVLVVGGHSGRRENMEVYASAEVYSPETRGFETAGTLEIPRHKHDAVELSDGRVLVIGGADRTDNVHYETTEVYDPRTASFERGPSMAHRRYKIAGTSVRLPSGDVLVTSGAEVAELLDVESGEFREVPGGFPAAYRFAAVAALPAGDVLVTGGYSDRNENTAGIWRLRGL